MYPEGNSRLLCKQYINVCKWFMNIDWTDDNDHQPQKIQNDDNLVQSITKKSNHNYLEAGNIRCQKQ